VRGRKTCCAAPRWAPCWPPIPGRGLFSARLAGTRLAGGSGRSAHAAARLAAGASSARPAGPGAPR
jgi:hypothetical protein